MKRRMDTWNVGYTEGGSIPEPVKRLQHYVHVPGIYDLEVDTSVMSAQENANLIHKQLEDESPTTMYPHEHNCEFF